MWRNVLIAAAAAAVILLAVIAPPWISGVRDREIVGVTHLENVGTESSGYRHVLTVGERLRMLANSKLGKTTTSFKNLGGGEYLTYQQAVTRAGEELVGLAARGVLPPLGGDMTKTVVNTEFQVIVDDRTPRYSMAVWSLGFQSDGMSLSITMDASTGMIYEFTLVGEKIMVASPQTVAEQWKDYLGMPAVDDLDSLFIGLERSNDGVFSLTGDGEEIFYILTREPDLLSLGLPPQSHTAALGFDVG